jgi:hypothetical protein
VFRVTDVRSGEQRCGIGGRATRRDGGTGGGRTRACGGRTRGRRANDALLLRSIGRRGRTAKADAEDGGRDAGAAVGEEVRRRRCSGGGGAGRQGRRPSGGAGRRGRLRERRRDCAG